MTDHKVRCRISTIGLAIERSPDCFGQLLQLRSRAAQLEAEFLSVHPLHDLGCSRASTQQDEDRY
jgi:hypothetical protein